MSDVLVSIIIPTFNRARYLPRAVQSVLAQQFDSFELIVVDDGSTDETQAVLSSISDSRVIRLWQENKGIPGALNAGHDIARGKYVTWMGDDCWVEPDWLDFLVSGFDPLPKEYGMVFSDFFLVNTSELMRTTNLDLKENDSIGASFMYRRSVYLDVGPYDDEFFRCEDYEYWLRIARHYRLKHLDGKPRFFYFNVPGEAMPWKPRQLELRSRLINYHRNVKLVNEMPEKKRNVVSFSLGENNSWSLEGAIANAKKIPRMLRDWRCRFYVGKNISNAALNELRMLDAEIVHMEGCEEESRSWRLLVADDVLVDKFICRDVETTIEDSEIASIQTWLSSGRNFYAVLPSPSAVMIPNLWGGTTNILPDLLPEIEKWKSKGEWQNFMEAVVWPQIRNNCLVARTVVVYPSSFVPAKPEARSLKIKVVIMSHNTPGTTTELYFQLSPVFDTVVFDSGSEPSKRPLCPHLRFPNLYWTGCWNKALELYGDSDVLWVIGGDVSLLSKAEEYRRCIESMWPFGIWSPTFQGRCRYVMEKSNLTETVADVWQLEGIAFAIGTKFLAGIKGFPAEMRIGWGCDIWVCHRAKYEQRDVLLDGRVILYHPHEQGYPSEPALQEMLSFFEKTYGVFWRSILHHEYDFFSYHLVGQHNMGPRISVAIPAYNRGGFIARTIRSVMEQKTGNVEVVVADDGSTDNTEQVMLEMVKEFPGRILYVKQEHKGVSDARNLAVSRASSNLVFTLDSDDCLFADTLEICLREIELGADIAYVDLKNRSGTTDSINLNLTLMRDRNTVACCALMRKSVWEDVGGYRSDMKDGCEDWEFWISCIEKGKRFVKANGAAVLIDDTHTNRMSLHLRKYEVYVRHREFVESIHPMFYSGKYPKTIYPSKPVAGVSVIISSYNQLSSLRLCLMSLREQTMLPYEVVVADDGSEDGTVEWVCSLDRKDWPFKISLVEHVHDGYRLAAVNNAGSAVATGRRLLFTNADVVHAPEVIETHDGLDGKTVGIGVIKSIAEDASKSLVESTFSAEQLAQKAKDCPGSRTNLKYRALDPNVNPLGVWGGCLSVPTLTFIKVGRFDEEFAGWGGEDADLARRCISEGCVVHWVDKSESFHLDHPTRDYAFQQTGSARYASLYGQTGQPKTQP